MPVGDKFLERLLILDGEIMEVGNGYWVSFKARQVTATTARLHGIKYSLCLFAPNDDRVVCFDNAHPISIGKGPAKKKITLNDHVHRGEMVELYSYTDAETLLVDFWDAVYDYLKKEGVQ